MHRLHTLVPAELGQHNWGAYAIAAMGLTVIALVAIVYALVQERRKIATDLDRLYGLMRDLLGAVNGGAEGAKNELSELKKQLAGVTEMLAGQGNRLSSISERLIGLEQGHSNNERDFKSIGAMIGGVNLDAKEANRQLRTISDLIVARNSAAARFEERAKTYDQWLIAAIQDVERHVSTVSGRESARNVLFTCNGLYLPDGAREAVLRLALAYGHARDNQGADAQRQLSEDLALLRERYPGFEVIKTLLADLQAMETAPTTMVPQEPQGMVPADV